MSEVPSELRYTKTHEWARLGEDGVVTVGITDHAQEQLGDLVFVELPEVGRHCGADEACVVVESVKAASDVYCPVAGEVVALNEMLADSPDLINNDPYGEGWLFQLQPDDPGALDDLLDAAGYEAMIADED